MANDNSSKPKNYDFGVMPQAELEKARQEAITAQSARQDETLQQLLRTTRNSSTAMFARAVGAARPRPNVVPSKATDIVNNRLIPEMLVLDFPKGYSYFQDYAALIGSDTQANRVFRLVVDYCEFDNERFIASVERIMNLPTTNPDNLDGVSELVMRFAMELYMLAHRKRLFNVPGPVAFPFEFSRFAGSRIVLQRKLKE